jgi:hypothetical protein
MRRYRENLCGRLRNNLRISLEWAAFFICIFPLTSYAKEDRLGPDESIGVRSDRAVDDANTMVTNDIHGPTVLLGYSREAFKKNPISSFMYFVPLISPTRVNRETSVDNEQQVGIVSYEKNVTSNSFTVVCEFEIVGKGFHKNMFDSAGMIAVHTAELKKGQLLKNTLDYINFEGEGFGRIEVKGTMDDSVPTVTEVDVQFNARGHKSPVTIGLYDIKPENGQYKYENRSNLAVARVNTLIFKKSGTDPRMGIKVASIGKSSDVDGFWGSLKGKIANLLIKPTPVDKLGNDTMLDFGRAMLEQKPEFTFPLAKNIGETKGVIAPQNNKLKKQTKTGP